MPFAARRVARRTARRTASRQSAAAPPPEAEAVPAAAPDAPDESAYMAELEQLHELKTQGVISEEDHEAKKQKLLGI